jgi:predicted enzyme related to lactoylglutathione lyase
VNKETNMAHPVMWFEVAGQDAARLRSFYADLFGWKYELAGPHEYGLVDTGAGRGIPGGVGPTYPGGKPWVTFYVETPDVERSLGDATRLGGSVIVPRTVLPDVTLGVFSDPEGHVIGLVEARVA